MHWRRKWQPTPVFLPGESHEQRSLVGYSPWGHKELDMTESLRHTHTHTHTHTRAGVEPQTRSLVPRPVLFLLSIMNNSYYSKCSVSASLVAQW